MWAQGRRGKLEVGSLESGVGFGTSDGIEVRVLSGNISGSESGSVCGSFKFFLRLEIGRGERK